MSPPNLLMSARTEGVRRSLPRSPSVRYYGKDEQMAVHAHRCKNARPPYAHDFMLYDTGDGEHSPFTAMMACRKCGEVRTAQEEALPPVALDDVLASVIRTPPTPRARAKPVRRKR